MPNCRKGRRRRLNRVECRAEICRPRRLCGWKENGVHTGTRGCRCLHFRALVIVDANALGAARNPTHQSKHAIPQSAGRQVRRPRRECAQSCVRVQRARRRAYCRFFGGGGLGVPVVSYAPRPMWTQLVVSRRIMVYGRVWAKYIDFGSARGISWELTRQL
jgi:hypothetical protein